MPEPTQHTPQPPGPIQSGSSSLPHIYVDEKERSIKQWILIAFLSITVLSIPLGVYLVSQRTGALPQAAPNTPQPEVSIRLDTPNQNISDGAEFPVHIKIKSDFDSSNLFAAKLKFPPKNFEIVRIATDSASANNPPGVFFASSWLGLNFDNNLGTASIIGGVPNPGFKSEVASPAQDYILATVFFRAKGSTKADITLEDVSSIYRNSDNQNVLQTKTGLSLNLTFSSSSTPIPNPIIKPLLSEATSSSFLISPKGGEVYSYYKSIPIEWNTLNLRSIKQIDLFINDKFYGILGTNIDNSGRVLWQPNSTLLLPLISNQNTFKIGISALTKTGQTVTDKSQGPFGLIPSAEFTPISSPSAILNVTSSDSLITASKLYSNFNLTKLINPEADLNKDNIVNELDLYLLRSLLLSKDLLN